jgi:hypothetical protein
VVKGAHFGFTRRGYILIGDFHLCHSADLGGLPAAKTGIVRHLPVNQMLDKDNLTAERVFSTI